MHLWLYHTVEELKAFEEAGCGLLYDGLERVEWSSLFLEIEEFKNGRLTFEEQSTTQVTVGDFTVSFIRC
jgi:hypothetical protein